MSTPGKTFRLRDLIALSLLGAVTAGAQAVMAPLPNIEPVTLFFICFTLVYGLRALWSCCVFVLLEGLLYGFGFWFVNYLYIWAVLVLAVWLLRRNRSFVLWTVLAAAYGLAFGALCALPYIAVSGWRAAFAYWIAGIPFDLIHCAGNAFMTGVLLRPLTALLTKLNNGYNGNRTA